MMQQMGFDHCEVPSGRRRLFAWAPSWDLLGHPFALCCVVLLIVNDHLLKHTYPGWLTGKLSDLAGVGIAGMVFAALLGRAVGTAVTAAAFTALQLSPQAAQLSAPLLGGVTLNDAEDLVALGVLIPVWWIAGRSRRSITGDRFAGVSLLPVVNAIVAVSATTATSCAPSPAVIQVAGEGGRLYAAVNIDDTELVWAVRDVAGPGWTRSDGPMAPPPSTAPFDSFEGVPPQGPVRACVDERCWMIRPDRTIQARAGDGAWAEEFDLSDAEYQAISTGCFDGQQGVLGSIAAVEGAHGVEVVASLGAVGVLERSRAGSWTRARVLSAPPIPATTLERELTRSAIYGGVLLAGLLALVGRRWPSFQMGLVVVGIGSVCTVVATGMAQFMTPTTIHPDRVSAWMAPFGFTLTAIAAVVVARHQPRLASQPPRPPFPWPPPSPP